MAITPTTAGEHRAGLLDIIVLPALGSSSKIPATWTTARDEHGIPELEQSRSSIERTVSKAQDFFASHGIGTRQGNGPVDIYHDLAEPNAGYVTARNGAEALVFGFDDRTGVSYGMAEDVVAHEYAHKIVNNQVHLPAKGSSGIVGEHLADVFAAVLDDDDPWTIGEAVRPGGLRSMIEPDHPRYDLRDEYGRPLPHPGHVEDFVHTPDDDGGVHINVGILNRAAAQIGESIGRDKLGEIYAHTLKHTLPNHAGLAEAVVAVKDATATLYGTNSREYDAVQAAWESIVR